MSNVISLTTREAVKVDTIEEHIEDIKDIVSKNPGITKAVTILIDDTGVTWQIHRTYCNVTNGDLFMALALLKDRIVKEVHDV